MHYLRQRSTAMTGATDLLSALMPATALRSMACLSHYVYVKACSCRRELISSVEMWTGIKVVDTHKKVKVARTRLPSVGFRSWSRFLAVSLQVTWVINLAVGCHYFSTRPAVTHATLKRAATHFAAWQTEARLVWTVCLRLLPDSVVAAIWTQALLRLSPAR